LTETTSVKALKALYLYSENELECDKKYWPTLVQYKLIKFLQQQHSKNMEGSSIYLRIQKIHSICFNKSRMQRKKWTYVKIVQF